MSILSRCLKSWRSRPKGFSLVELLVVGAVVSILLAVAVPAFKDVKESAHRTECLSNLRQIGAASTLYLSDHANVFPPAVDYTPWRGGAFPGGVANLVDRSPHDIQAAFSNYIGVDSRVWVCRVAGKYGRKDAASSDPYTLGNFGTPSGWGYKHDITYRWNSLTTRDSGSMTNYLAEARAFPQYASRLKLPARAALVWDLRDDLPNFGLPQLHRGKVNCLFVDGHVDSVPVAMDGGGNGIATEGTLWWYAGWATGQGWEGAQVPYP